MVRVGGQDSRGSPGQEVSETPPPADGTGPAAPRGRGLLAVHTCPSRGGRSAGSWRERHLRPGGNPLPRQSCSLASCSAHLGESVLTLLSCQVFAPGCRLGRGGHTAAGLPRWQRVGLLRALPAPRPEPRRARCQAERIFNWTWVCSRRLLKTASAAFATSIFPLHCYFSFFFLYFFFFLMWTI